MRNQVASTETGFIGRLTAEQEQKLQRLWGVVLLSFDTDTTKSHSDAQPEPSATVARPGAQQKYDLELVQRTMTGITAPELRQAWLHMLKQENADALLLRFLRARKWDVSQAFAMLVSAITWRCKGSRVDDEINPKGDAWCAEKQQTGRGQEQKDARDFLTQLRLGKVYIHGRDRLGRPIGYIHVALHKPGAQSEWVLEKLVVHTIETARCLFVPPVESACVLFDMTGFSLSNMEWFIVKFIIQCFEANYPECLGVLLIHNAPWVFSGLWKIIRGLLDPVVKAKVNFTQNVQDLEKWIPPENIIKRLGGVEDWQYEYREPSELEDAPLADAITKDELMKERNEMANELLETTRLWLDSLSAKDTEKAATQQSKRQSFIEALRQNYWRLDAFVRSRSLLDRTGVLKPGGVVNLYPERSKSLDKATTDEIEVRASVDVAVDRAVVVAS
ncbi:CRAL/TRIO domain protein [Xylariaceae sp. FL0016]|nr:CRAL/TRIO domain protein [Xylariaceae sp. FL0016]